MGKEKLLKIIVETIEGEAVEVTINEENKIEQLMNEAMRGLGIDTKGAPYEIRLNNSRLENDKKIKEYGLVTGDTVILQRIPNVG